MGESGQKRFPFFNETLSNEVTLKFSLTGRPVELSKMKFEIVATPLLMECGELSSSTGQADADQRHVFQCGDLARDYSLSGGAYLGDYCVSGKFVCDGYVNCMLPDKEGIDEDSQFCTANRNYSSHNETLTIIQWVMLSVAIVVAPVLLFCYCIGKIFVYYKKKRAFFLKLGEELDQKSVIETKIVQISQLENSDIEKEIMKNDPPTLENFFHIVNDPSVENYVQICHQNYLNMNKTEYQSFDASKLLKEKLCD